MLTKLYEMLGFDHWSWSCHHPDMLIDPEEVSADLKSLEYSIDVAEPFHAFFTLILDQAMLGFYWLTLRISSGLHINVYSQSLFRFLMPVSTSICRLLLRPLKKLDEPWTERGLSNGFLVVATKLAK